MKNSKTVYFSLLLVVIGLVLVQSTCIRDEQGDIIEKPQTGFGLGILRNVGCSIEKGVRKIGDGAKSIGGEVKQVFQQGINVFTQPFQSNDNENDNKNDNNNYNGNSNDNNNYNDNNKDNNNHNQPYNNKQPHNSGQVNSNSPDSTTLPYELLIDVRAQEIFHTRTEYLARSVQTEKPSQIPVQPTSVDDRFLLNSPKICPEGSRKDRHDICREV